MATARRQNTKKKPAAKKPATKKSATKPVTKKPATTKPAAKKPATQSAGGMPAASNAAALFEQYWQRPNDRELLRVYADALEQAGDPRGKFIQLSLVADRTPEQEEARGAMERKLKGKLVGPAAKYLREVEFSPTTGLVEKARTELPNLIAGLDEIGRLNPRLILTLTSIKTQKDAAALGAVDPAKLGRIWFLDFGMITGSFGGCQLNDKQLEAVAPAFAELEHLQLSCAGAPEKCFTPEGLRALGRHARKLRYLAIEFHQEDLPPARDYARAIAETPGFATLRGLEFADLVPDDLQGFQAKLNPIGESLNFEARDQLADRLEPLLA